MSVTRPGLAIPVAIQALIGVIAFWAMLVVGFPSPLLNRHAFCFYVMIAMPVADYTLLRLFPEKRKVVILGILVLNVAALWVILFAD